MIIGTAGHIDHGKTTLVRALTGVDTDRLPEEKTRGISIELGYAYLDTEVGGGERRIGFVDVPGHERLVHTMVAGASGIDFALLVIAADDGPMPQTREHLAVLSLLGLDRGAIVLTKADRVEATRLAAAQAEARALVAHTALAGATVWVTSATDGRGIGALRDWLFDQARSLPTAVADDRVFRLAIDRAFTLDGVGTVVTGLAHSGTVRIGDTLTVTGGSAGGAYRVRSLHAQNRAVTQAHAGQRCAIALAGADRGKFERGMWLLADDGVWQTQRVDAAITVWPEEPSALRSGAMVHVHAGTAATTGSIAVLDSPSADRITPGGAGLVQILLRQPLALWRGDRVVLRDAAASRTVAGGIVIDPTAPTRYRKTAQRLAELKALQAADIDARFRALLAVSPNGVAMSGFRRAEARHRHWQPYLDRAALIVAEGDGGHALGAEAATVIDDAILGAVARYHETHPDEIGVDRGRLRRMAAPRLPLPLFEAMIGRAITAGSLAQRGPFVHSPAHAVHLSEADTRIAQQLAVPLLEAGFQGSWIRDLATDCAINESLLRASVARLSQSGDVHQVVRDLVYPVATMHRLAAIVREEAARRDGNITAAQLRDATHLGRKRAIQILEYLDRVGLCRRVGDSHRVRAECSLFLSP